MRPTTGSTDIHHFTPVDLSDPGNAKPRRDLFGHRAFLLHHSALVAVSGACPKADDRRAGKTKWSGRIRVSRHATSTRSDRDGPRRRWGPDLLEERRNVEFVVAEIEVFVGGVGEDVLANLIHAEHDASPV
jgi:hypothetical protein